MRCQRPGPVFCLLLRVSSDYAQPITGQVTEVTCPVIGGAQPELTPSKRQKTDPENTMKTRWKHGKHQWGTQWERSDHIEKQIQYRLNVWLCHTEAFVGREERSRQGLLITWFIVSPWHQYPWHKLFFKTNPYFTRGKNSIYKTHLASKNDTKCNILLLP